ncbi:Major Facilitator Superfamily protein [Streptomyces sp. BpilaLS-43]|uniref:MFS transporter n=1 Tax=Streptomyces sp. BpilaLS-43 TaxID=1839778 RepID=UPI00081B6E3D|nr:MFS transporter [Streptomyces sp. BpilaLS-43]SCE01829.1 Major Facilitator Superfamily protein [Streptomyces sp. BpilaLS-43]
MSAAHRRITLTGSVVGAAVVALDGTVLTVVQPTLQKDLHASFAQVRWTSTGYLIAVAGLLVLAGRLGDRYGHRRLFAVGMLGFGVTSAGIGLASGIGTVIVLRVAQGAFGALLQPATLGMLRAAFPPDRLGLPIALRTSAIGLAAATGPLLGGALAVHQGWRAAFFLNVPPTLLIGLLVLAVREPAPQVAAPAGQRPPARLDLPGAGLLACTVGGLVYALAGVSGDGGAGSSATGLAVAAVTGLLFAGRQRSARDPLVPPGVLASPALVPGLGVLVAASAALYGSLFPGVYHLQDVLGLDPLRCALVVLPGPVAMVLAAPLSVLPASRYGPRRTVVGAMLLLALGDLLLSRLGAESGTTPICIAFLMVGAGFGTVMVVATDVVVRQAPERHAGVVGGLQQTAMNIGPALGVAAATALLTVSTPGATASATASGSREALIHAVPPTLSVLAAVAVAGALSARGLPGRTPVTPRGRTVRVRR